MAVHDIEEIVAEGKLTHTCPFHTSQDLVMEGAGIVFITYSQLFDPSIRSSGGFAPIFKNAIVVIIALSDRCYRKNYWTQQTWLITKFFAVAISIQNHKCLPILLQKKTPLTTNISKLQASLFFG